jgi:acyl-CoA reductase-like NAD-dependent aldehyde dehydrogenase
MFHLPRRMTTSSASFALAPAYPYYLANKAVYANRDLVVTDKFTGHTATHVALADAKAIAEAAHAAHAAQDACRRMKPFERKAVLQAVANEVRARADEFAAALCVEAGKPIKDSRTEVARLIDTFEIAAEEAVRIRGEWDSLEISARAANYESVVRRFPIGPVSMIAPFNFPLNLAAHKIAPAIAAGCPWVMKPASRTPIGALLLAEILSRQSSYPAGAFSVLPCSRDGADLFTTDERFKLLSFTGSPDVGWDLKAKAGKKKVTLELGGNAACIVDDLDEGLDAIVGRIVIGAFYQSGQSCISVQRVLVRRPLYAAVRDALVAATKQLVQGDPRDEKTFIGPMIAESEAKRLHGWITDAKARGATVLCGGERSGVFVSATVLENVPKDCAANTEEAFGPLVNIEPYDTFEEAIRIANDSKFGLQAGIFTSNVHKADYAFEELEVGGVVINDVPSLRVDSQPYGGVKDSGLGREGLRSAIEDMTEVRIQIKKRTAAAAKAARN